VNVRSGEVREFHRFVPLLSRLVVEDNVCETCDSPAHRHAGPVSPRT
jgi:hypothetical protein